MTNNIEFATITVTPEIVNRCWQAEPVRIWTGSALPLMLVGLPSVLAGGEVVGVEFEVVNADGATLTVDAATDGKEGWFAILEAGNFSAYGAIEKGIKVWAKVSMPDGGTARVIVAVSDFEVVQSSASAEAGDPTRTFQEKGGDQFVKTEIVEGVQHYAKFELARDPRVNSYLARYTGDYILVGGNFQEIVK